MNIQQIIDDKFEEIVALIKREIPQEQQEPDSKIVKELRKYIGN